MKRATTKRRTWIKIAEGCYDDGHAIVVLARKRVPGRRNPLRATDRMPRFDANGRQYTRLNNLDCIVRHAQLLDDLRTGKIGGEFGAPGSLLFAIDAWTRTHAIAPGVKSGRIFDLHQLLKPWRTSNLAPMQATAIRRAHIVDALDAMRKPNGEPFSPTSLNGRKRALGVVLRIALEQDQAKRGRDQDADDVVVPTSLVPGQAPRDLESRGMDLAFVEMILAAMSDRSCARSGEPQAAYGKAKLFLSVMAWTALPPASLRRLARVKVSWARSTIEYPARRKGKRPAPAFLAPALPQAMAALRRFDAAGLWGTSLSGSALRGVWSRAVATVRASLKAAAEIPGATDDAIALYELFQNQVPANSRPYDLRHSFATEFLRRTGDRTALQQILQHKDQRMLERYTKGAIPDRVNDAMSAMRAHWAPETVAAPLRLVPKGS